MLNGIKRLILNNNFAFYICSNILAFPRGVIVAPYKNKTILIKNRRKYIIKDKSLYTFDILKCFNRYINDFEPDLITKTNYEIYDYSKIIKHKLKNGLPKQYFAHSIPENKKDIEQYLKYINIHPGANVLDLGANCGLSTYHLSKTVGNNGRVIACEADYKNFEILQKNIKMWKLDNVESINCAAWSHNTIIDFSEEVSLGSCASVFRTFSSANSQKVQALSLMEIAENFNLKRIDAIKMNIESSEYAVFENIDEFFSKYKPRFIIELHKNQEGIIDRDLLYRKFEANNYIVKEINDALDFPLLYAESQ